MRGCSGFLALGLASYHWVVLSLRSDMDTYISMQGFASVEG